MYKQKPITDRSVIGFWYKSLRSIHLAGSDRQGLIVSILVLLFFFAYLWNQPFFRHEDEFETDIPD
jgi:hypothetical protein